MGIIKKVFKYMLILFLLIPLVACEEKTEEPILPIFTGINDVTIEVGDSFNPKEGITATWNGIDITADITISGNINTDVEGVYNLEYRVESKKGDVATKTRKITVVETNTEDPVLPVFAGINDVTIEKGESFDPKEGVTATWKDVDITSSITIVGSVDTTKVGIYNLEYRVESEKGDVATMNRKVTVIEPTGGDPILPIFAGIKNSTIKQYDGFNPKEGITATWKGIDITRLITITGLVDTTKVGVYNLEYRVESKNGDVATKTRKVTVTEKTSSRFTENEALSQYVSNVGHIQTNGNVVNDNGVSTYQEVNVLKQGEDVLVASWSKFSNGKYVTSSTLDIAKDFELNNPNYEVIAAINGDFFYLDSSGNVYTTGPNILFGNRVIKPDSFYGGSYYSVQFNQFGKKLGVHKTLTFSSNINLTLYDESDALIYYNDQIFFNKTTLNDNETSIIFKKSYTYDSNVTYFILNQKNKYTYLSHTYFEANVENKITSPNSQAIVIATKDPVLISLLKSNQRIIAQNMTNGIGYSDMVIGIDSPIIENSRVKRFDEMSTDTTEQTSRNKARNPRTGFGYDSAGNMVLITVDGRGTSNGVDLREFGYIMNYYGIVEGYNLDGGGSTQAVLRFNGKLQYVNTPSETYRSVGNAILFIREKEAKPKCHFEIKNGKIYLNIFDKTGISEIDILINGESNKYTNIDNEIILTLTNPKSTAIAITYVKNGQRYHLLNEIYGGARKYININNAAVFDVNEGYSFEQNIGLNSKIFVFSYEDWQAISNIVDASNYSKEGNYKMANLSLAITDANGKVVAIRLYQKWVADHQPGIQLTTDASGSIVVNSNDAFNRNNVEIGVMNLLPEGGFVYVFATPTPTVDDGFSVAMKFAYEHLFGLKPSLYNTALLLDGGEFTDWTNPPINPFAEGFKVTITTEELGAEPKKLYVKIGDKEHIAELDTYKWDVSSGVGSITAYALVFSKSYLAGMPGYETIDTADDEGRNYTIQYSILAIIDASGKVVQIRIHPGHKLTWSGTENKIVAEESLTATTLHHGLLADIPDGGYVVLFQNTNLAGNPIRAWGCQQLTGFQDVNNAGYANTETGGVANMTVNPFAEGFIIEFVNK